MELYKLYNEQNNEENWKHFVLHITHGIRIATLRRLGLRKNPVGLAPLVGFFSATFCGCWSLLRKALIRNRKTSYTYLR
jgi:hypothetical protein